MTIVRPPAVATWLLSRLGRRERLESLAGDLWEEHQQRRSSLWYWRHVVVAIAVGACQDVRDHTWLAVRAILTAYGFWWLYWWLLVPSIASYWNAYLLTLPPGMREPAFFVLGIVLPMAGMGCLSVGDTGRVWRRRCSP